MRRFKQRSSNDSRNECGKKNRAKYFSERACVMIRVDSGADLCPLGVAAAQRQPMIDITLKALALTALASIAIGAVRRRL
jgi:hypothetical protein